MSHQSRCWCGNIDLASFSQAYLRCPVCETLITARMPDPEFTRVRDDERDFYGREYWFSHQEQDLGFTNITLRARADLPERCLHWLHTALKYKLPPGRSLELGCASGGFVALLQWSGFDAIGLELSPWVVNYAHEIFDIPMLLGPVEEQSLEPGSLDIIALMDVLEHLPDPAGAMRHCLNLLKPDGVLIVQTPRYPEGLAYEEMLARNDPFLEQLKANQHLYLFSRHSIRELFGRLGAQYLEFEPAIFAQYDMFLVASRAPLAANAPEAIASSLSTKPHGRMVLALLDLDDQFQNLKQRHAEAETDRAARLEVIRAQSSQLGRLPGLEADHAARLQVIQQQGREIGELRRQLGVLRHRFAAAEVDRAARMAVIHQQADQIGQLRRQLDDAEAKRPRLRNNRIARRLVRAQPDRLPQSSNGSPDSLYRAIREPKHQGGVGYTPEVIQHIIDELSVYGHAVKEYTIDVADYWAYFEQAAYKQKYPRYYASHLYEKSLEHYIAARLLDLSADDVYVDIASEGSPVPEIYQRLFGCVTYRQDLSYPAGLNGTTIGGDAAELPVEDGFASKMALHCSFEHFEGDSDIRFVREVGRVLRAGGAVCIVPFYLFDAYAIQTDPSVSVPAQVPFEEDAIVYCRPGWNNRHGRFYDPAHVMTRLLHNAGDLGLTIYRITNARDVDPGCYAEFAALLTKP